MIFAYITCGSTEEAERLGRMIIEQKLAHNIHAFPVSSMSMVKGEFHVGTVVKLWVNTLETKLQDIEDLITSEQRGHVPFVATLEVKRVNHAYKEWLSQMIA